MPFIRCFASLLLLASGARAAEAPAETMAVKGSLLLSDDFERAELGRGWRVAIPAFTLERGALKGTQTRYDTPATEGRPAVTGHQAVLGIDLPTGDSVIELRFRFAGATALAVEFDDRNFKGSHYGHLCLVRIRPDSVTLIDQREGTMRNDIFAMSKDPARKAEREKLLQGRIATFPAALAAGEWHTLALETVGDAMRAVIDGRPAAFLRSPGIAHPTKSRIELGCAGADGWFDDLKVWAARPATP